MYPIPRSRGTCGPPRKLSPHRGFSLVHMITTLAISTSLMAITARLLWTGHHLTTDSMVARLRMEDLWRAHHRCQQDIGDALEASIVNNELVLRQRDGSHIVYRVESSRWLREAARPNTSTPLVQPLLVTAVDLVTWHAEETSRGLLLQADVVLESTTARPTLAPYHWEFHLMLPPHVGQSPSSASIGEPPRPESDPTAELPSNPTVRSSEAKNGGS
ncbi:MAG: hypothetical protein KatS3mg111_1633 [Pirellulaceae bacterium]|nr:MAG: hypothetical protein KatS3mg111_1633 [Pirellulaceae bacterium]